MKKIVLLLLFFVAVVVAQAQQHHEKFVRAKFKEIVKELGIDEETTKELEPLYLKFTEEMRPKKERYSMAARNKPLTEEQLELQTRQRLAMAKHIATVREKYYDVFRKVLPPSKIVKMYQIEKDIMKRVTRESVMRRGRMWL